MIRGVAIHLLQKCRQIGALQNTVHFVGHIQGFGRSPGGQHARVHHQQRCSTVNMLAGQRLQAQPLQQRVAVRGLQNAGQRVASRGFAGAMCGRQQMQVVVAQQGAQGIAVRHASAQHGGGVGAPVDEIAQKVDGIPARRKTDQVEQTPQCAVATLDIANTVKCHGVRFTF
jgi:hypothetical protein